MSEPVTNAEVEDVLSSIRRLVSEDKRPLQAPRAAPQANDKLVLTPALRVAEQAPSATEPEPQASEPAPPPTSQYKAEGQIDDWNDDGAQDDSPGEAALEENAFHDLDPAEEREAPAAQPAPTEREMNIARARTQDTLYPFIDDEEELEDEAEVAEPPQQVRNAPAEPAAEEEDEPAPDVMFSHRFATARPTPDGNAPLRPGTLSEKIAALETAIGNSREDWEPEAAGSGDYAGTPAPAMAWEDDEDAPARRPRAEPRSGGSMESGSPSPFARPSAQQEAPAERPQEPPQEASDAFDGDDQVLDEEALRDLVAEIVRAELQGALGERITRNVRKLVRREIHRALTAQELE